MVTFLGVVVHLSHKSQQRYLRQRSRDDFETELETVLQRERERVRHVRRQSLDASEERRLQDIQVMLAQVTVLAVGTQAKVATLRERYARSSVFARIVVANGAFTGPSHVPEGTLATPSGLAVWLVTTFHVVGAFFFDTDGSVPARA